MKKTMLVIPSLEPKENLIRIIEDLSKEFSNIIVVNDGSSEKYDFIFEKIKKMNIVVLKHGINLGKGRALKTAFNYILSECNDIDVIVTADSDGQHLSKDIFKCSSFAMDNPNSLILGVRDFSKKDVPLRSRFGNKITRRIFKYLLGINISDTQTGLRAFSRSQMKDFMITSGEKFEYETNMLIDNKNKGYKFLEVSIETVYIENNETSHFNPIKDSIQIYKLFVKYIIASISSFVIDISFFKIGIGFGATIVQSTIIARIISSLFNYKINRNSVFKTYNKTSFYKYYFLVVIQMFVSAYTVKLLDSLHINKSIVLIKIFVDIIIFMVNYYIQREWVFKEKRSE